MKHMFIVDCSQYCIFMDVTLHVYVSGFDLGFDPGSGADRVSPVGCSTPKIVYTNVCFMDVYVLVI